MQLSADDISASHNIRAEEVAVFSAIVLPTVGRRRCEYRFAL